MDIMTLMTNGNAADLRAALLIRADLALRNVRHQKRHGRTTRSATAFRPAAHKYIIAMKAYWLETYDMPSCIMHPRPIAQTKAVWSRDDE